MKVTQEKLPASQIGLEIEIPAEKSKSAYETTIKTLAKTVNIPGFRKGKVPRPILLQRLGHQSIKANVLDELIQSTLKEAIEQESINSIGNYKLETDFAGLVENYNPNNTINFKATVDVPPDVQLNQYGGFNLQAEEVAYDPASVDNILDEYRSRKAILTPVEDRPAQMGDMAIVDFEGRKPSENEGEEGELIEGTKAEESQIELSEGKFIPGFVEGIVGMNLGETKKLNLTFPEGYFEEELSEQPVIFTITLHELKEKELPELDDEFAKEVSEMETIAELRESLEKQYKEKAENETKEKINEAIINQLLESNDVDLPETLIDEEIQTLLMQTVNQLQNAGIDVNKFLTKDIIETMRENAKPEAVKNVKVNLFIEKIAEQESLIVTEEEVTEKVNQILENSQDQNYDMDKLNKYVRQDLITEKTLTWLREHNQVELLPEGSLKKEETESENSENAETSQPENSES